MKIEDLELFAVVGRLGNLHRAADEIGITQSAVSKAIRRLETSFELRLLERSPSGVILTPDGAALQASAMRIKTSMDGIVQEMRARKLGMSGLVRIGAVPGMVEPVLIPVIQSMMKSHPGVRFQVRSQLSPALYRMIDERELDVAITAFFQPMPSGLSHETVGEDGHSIVVRADHPIHTLPGSMRLDSLRWIVPVAGVPIREWFDDALRSAGVPAPDIVVETDVPPAVLAQIVRKSDIATVFALGTLRSAAGRGLVPVALAAAPATTQLVTVWKRGAYQPPLAMEACRLIKEAAGKVFSLPTFGAAV